LERHQESQHPHPLRLHHPAISRPSLSSALLHFEWHQSLSASPLLKNATIFTRALQPWLFQLLSFSRILIALLPPWPPPLLEGVQALLA